MTTITKLKAVEDAFEAVLRWIDDYVETTGFETVEAMADAALPGLRSVIAEMEAGEPVAIVKSLLGGRMITTIGDVWPDGLEIGTKLYTHPQPKAEPADATIDDPVVVPRGLLGAACAAIDKKADAPKVLERLRAYTMGAAQPKAEPASSALTLIRPMTFGCAAPIV